MLFVTLLLAFSLDSTASAGMKGGKNGTGNIHLLGHDTFRITHGSIVGSASDAKKFQEKLPGKIAVVTLQKE